jgi:hypothetical protein
MTPDQWFILLRITSFSIAVAGFIEQLVYERLTIGDYRATRGLDDAIRFLAFSRVLSTASLSLVHVTIVASVILISPYTVHPDLAAFQLVWVRIAVSLMVIASTTLNLLARARAHRHVAAAG